MYNTETNLYDGYIYKITNKVNNKVYIGQTRSDPKHRWCQHKSTAKHGNNRNSYLYNSMRKYGLKNFNFVVIDELHCDNLNSLIERLDYLEISYIEEYDSLTPKGYNSTPGGDNISVKFVRPVDAYYASGELYKEYRSIAEASIDLCGETGKLNLTRCCTGKAQSCKGFIWRYHGEPFDKYPVLITQEYLDESNYVPVDKYNMNGVLIASYPSLLTAIKNTDSKSDTARSVIRGCCNGIYNQAYGYVWRYKGDAFDKYPFVINKRYRQINMYSLYNVYENSFTSIQEGMRFLGYTGKSGGHISDCCNKKRRSAYSHKWYYADDPDQPDKTKIKIA